MCSDPLLSPILIIEVLNQVPTARHRYPELFRLVNQLIHNPTSRTYFYLLGLELTGHGIFYSFQPRGTSAGGALDVQEVLEGEHCGCMRKSNHWGYYM
jgi:hypothetical protein